MSILWSARAENDLGGIYAHIARDSAFYAQRQIERLMARAGFIDSHPTAGHPVPEDIRGELREVHEGNYRIIYAFGNAGILIVTVVHMKQHLSRSGLRVQRPAKS